MVLGTNVLQFHPDIVKITVEEALQTDILETLRDREFFDLEQRWNTIPRLIGWEQFSAKLEKIHERGIISAIEVQRSHNERQVLQRLSLTETVCTLFTKAYAAKYDGTRNVEWFETVQCPNGCIYWNMHKGPAEFTQISSSNPSIKAVQEELETTIKVLSKYTGKQYFMSWGWPDFREKDEPHFLALSRDEFMSTCRYGGQTLKIISQAQARKNMTLNHWDDKIDPKSLPKSSIYKPATGSIVLINPTAIGTRSRNLQHTTPSLAVDIVAFENQYGDIRPSYGIWDQFIRSFGL